MLSPNQAVRGSAPPGRSTCTLTSKENYIYSVRTPSCTCVSCWSSEKRVHTARDPGSPQPSAKSEMGRIPKERPDLFQPLKRGPWPGPLLPGSRHSSVPGSPGPGWGWGVRVRGVSVPPTLSVSTSLCTQPWVTLAQKTRGIPIYLQNIKKSVYHLHISPILPFYTCTSVEK